MQGQRAGTVMGTREREEPSLPGSTSQLYFLILELRQTPYFIIDRMMDCWHLTVKEYVCKEHLKLDGEKRVDFIHFTLASSNKGNLPMKQFA